MSERQGKLILHQHNVIEELRARIKELEAKLDATETLCANDKSGCPTCSKVIDLVVAEKQPVAIDDANVRGMRKEQP